LAEAIANAADSLNQVGVFFAKLCAKATNVNVNGASAAVVLVSPHA
jgi:hypothetical protein